MKGFEFLKKVKFMATKNIQQNTAVAKVYDTFSELSLGSGCN